MGRPPEVRHVVGVVADMHLGAKSPPDIFVPVAQSPAYWIDLVIRTSGDPQSLEMPVRKALRELNRDLLIENATPIDAIVSRSLGLQRAQTILAIAVAGLSSAVAGVGLYALLAFAVTQRQREFGIRLALGSAPRALGWWVFRRGLRLTLAGVAAGCGITALLVRLLRAQVFGLEATSASTYLLASAALIVIAAAALLVPARRVIRADPLVTMRAE